MGVVCLLHMFFLLFLVGVSSLFATDTTRAPVTSGAYPGEAPLGNRDSTQDPLSHTQVSRGANEELFELRKMNQTTNDQEE